MILFYNSWPYMKRVFLTEFCSIFRLGETQKTEIPWNLCGHWLKKSPKYPLLQCQKPRFYFPLKFPVFSFWKSTCKNLVGRELLNNICQFWNFKEVVKNLNNSKEAERKLWDVALSKKEPPTPSHSINHLVATRKTNLHRCR